MYWAYSNTTQYWQVLANTQYPNTGIVRTLLKPIINKYYWPACRTSFLFQVSYTTICEILK